MHNQNNSRTAHRTGSTQTLTVVFLAILTGAVPVALNHSASRDLLLNLQLPPGLTATAQSSVGGWMQPFEFHEVTILDEASQLQIHVDCLKSGESIVGSLCGVTPEITFVRPSIRATLDESGMLPVVGGDSATARNFRFRIEEGSFVLRVPSKELPVVDVDGLQIKGGVSTDASGQWLSVDAISVFERVPLSEQHTEQNLALVAPLLSRSTQLQGTVSTHLKPMKIRIDADAPADQPLLQGTVTIHELNAKLKDGPPAKVLRLIEAMSRQPLPADLKLASDSTLDFQVMPDGVYHSGFSLLLPEFAKGVTVESSGMLYNDESIDLAVNVRMPPPQPTTSPFLNAVAAVAQEPLSLRVTGTTSDPAIAPAHQTGVAGRLTGTIAPAVHEEQSGALGQSIRGIIQAGASETKVEQRRRLPGQIFSLIRSIKEANQGR